MRALRPSSASSRAILLALAIVLITAMVAPASASALDLNPLDGFGLFGDAIGDVVKGALKTILKLLFGGTATHLTQGLVSWLVAIPHFTGGHVARLQSATAAMSFGAAGAVMSISIFRYW